MKAIFDFTPKFCPGCGREMHGIDTDSDYTAHCSFTCRCGVQYAKADTDKILRAAADSGGDMAHHASPNWDAHPITGNDVMAESKLPGAF